MRLLICLTITGLITLQCLGQTDSLGTGAGTDSSKPKATLTAGVVYCNNADYYGQRAEDRLPYVAVAASYRFKFGFYLTGMAYKLLNDTAGFISASNIGAGMNLKLSKKLSADISYSHTFYPSFSPFLQASNPDNASLAFTYENWLSWTANADYAFGKSTDVFVTLGIGKAINLGSIGRKDIVTITPSFNIVGGTQHFYQTYITEKRLQDSILGILLPPLTGDQSPGSSSFTKAVTEFNILSYNFKLPLAYNRSNYLLEAAYQLSILSNKAESASGKPNSFISISFYYQF